MSKPPSKNIRHDFVPSDVTEQINKSIAKWELFREESYTRARARLAEEAAALAPANVPQEKLIQPELTAQQKADIDALVDTFIEKERTYYALARIIELPQSGFRFILVYGTTNDETVSQGTGPFESLTKAKKWFLNSGR